MKLELVSLDMTHELDERDDFRHRFAELRGSSPEPADAGVRFLALQAAFDRLAFPLRRALLDSPLDWTTGEREEARWLHRTCDDFALLGYRLSDSAAKRLGMADEHARAVIAGTLFFMGETVKWDIGVASAAPHDLRKAHTLMRLAMDAGHHRDPMRLRVDGREADCTLESLYFRVLLLARFASGALNGKQIEILDAWMWLWMPVLSGVPTAPPGAALRADLDSSGGLQRGPRQDDGPSLYLPQAPIEAAYRAVVQQFHDGQMVPAEGIAAGFRIEEHVAVLDLIRRGLQQSTRAPVARAVRRRVDRPVEVYLGLAEIMGRAFAPPPPAASPVSLATVEDRTTGAARQVRDRDTAMGEIYDAAHRMARLLDESDTGLGLEGAGSAFACVAAGDLIAVRLSTGEPLVLGKVVRSVASKTPGHVLLGVLRLTAAARLIDVRIERTARLPEETTLIVVPGKDSCGRHDAWLVSERAFGEHAKLIVAADGRNFALRLNRARARGRGWVLAGFEVSTASPRYEFEIA